MEIQVNGEPRTLAPETCLENVIAELNIGNQAIAVAVNRQVISRSMWSQHRLNHGDQVDVVRAIGGG
jgi:sulfur carrier protein